MHTQTRHTASRRIFLGALLGFGAIATSALMQSSVRGSLLVGAQMPTQERTHSAAAIFSDISGALDERSAMLERKVHVSFVTEAGATPLSSFELHLKDFPLWITFTMQAEQSRAILNTEKVKQYLISHPPEGIPSPQSCTLLSTWVDDEGVLRAQTDCIAHDGYTIDNLTLAKKIADALESDQHDVTYVLTHVPGVVRDASHSTAKPMTRLSTGRSTFQGSGLSRKYNVRKALNERVHNVMVPADEVFSFNKTLGTVSLRRGWHMALTIFEGENLRPAPGGGICQASTTTYRAALAAGLPIIKQKNHSLYVTYYEKFGVGQDSTIFPGSQDLTFLNDTGGPILIQAYNDGDEAFVSIFGTDDGRSVVITGPYFGRTSPKDLLWNGKTLKNNEIGWMRTVTIKGEEPREEQFVSRYKALPKSLPSRWELTTLVTRGEPDASVVALDH